MKKLLLILGIALMSFGLLACETEKTYTLDEVIEAIELGFTGNDEIESVTTHISLPQQSALMKNAAISWSSNNASVLDEFGTVNRQLDDVEVVLTLTVVLSGLSDTKTFTVIVKGTNVYYDVTVHVGDEISDYRILQGQPITNLPNPSQPGFKFVGWFKDQALTIPFVVSSLITENIHLYAKFDVLTLANVTINYYYEKLTTDDYQLVDTVVVEAEVGTLYDATITPVGFIVNTEQGNLTGLVSSVTPLVLNVYLDREVYEIKYYSDGIQVDFDLYKYGQTINAVPGLTMSGFDFGGWSTTPDGQNPYTFGNIALQNVTLYAIWTAQSLYTGYYSSINNVTDANLRTALRILISTMKTLTYTSTSNMLNVSDRNPNNHNQVILVYNRAIVSGTWDGGSTWNKEHVWPQSKLGTASVSDIHNLKPCNPSVNSTRGNLPFAQGSGTNKTVTGGYYPGDADKGDIARILLYMNVRWNLIINTSSVGDLNMLLRWHMEDPVDDFERNRNNILYGYQENRNPFIDHPELVERIWGTIPTSSQSEQQPLWTPSFDPTFEVIEIIAYEIDLAFFKRENHQF
jgi:uncharacterized repeat protein (TIGR02543 family)